MATVHLIAQMPDDKLEEFLQLLRGWDDKRTDRQLIIEALNSKLLVADLVAMFKRLRPMFDDVVVIPSAQVRRNQG